MCLRPHRLFGGNGSGHVCCMAGVEKEGYMWWEQVGPCMESGWIAFEDSVRELAELHGARMAYTVHFPLIQV